MVRYGVALSHLCCSHADFNEKWSSENPCDAFTKKLYTRVEDHLNKPLHTVLAHNAPLICFESKNKPEQLSVELHILLPSLQGEPEADHALWTLIPDLKRISAAKALTLCTAPTENAVFPEHVAKEFTLPFHMTSVNADATAFGAVSAYFVSHGLPE